MNAMMSPMTMMPAMGPTMSMPGMGMPSMSQPMVPRCTMKVEKCKGGMKVTCTCEDEMACRVMQNLCMSLTGGMCSFCCMMNGMCVCCCNMTMAQCKCEMVTGGCCFTCTSGDPECCAMIEACCDCMCALMKSGCGCCVMMNGTPVCCC